MHLGLGACCSLVAAQPHGDPGRGTAVSVPERAQVSGCIHPCWVCVVAVQVKRLRSRAAGHMAGCRIDSPAPPLTLADLRGDVAGAACPGRPAG